MPIVKTEIHCETLQVTKKSAAHWEIEAYTDDNELIIVDIKAQFTRFISELSDVKEETTHT